MAGSADKLCGWPGCTKPWDPADGVFCKEHTVTMLDRVHKVEAEKAREVLAPFRDLEYANGGAGQSVGKIDVSKQRADRLQQAICEALVEAYNRGFGDGATSEAK